MGEAWVNDKRYIPYNRVIGSDDNVYACIVQLPQAIDWVDSEDNTPYKPITGVPTVKAWDNTTRYTAHRYVAGSDSNIYRCTRTLPVATDWVDSADNTPYKPITGVPTAKAWVDDTRYFVNRYVQGTDGNCYRCKSSLPTDATTDNTPYRPVTGASWATYWEVVTSWEYFWVQEDLTWDFFWEAPANIEVWTASDLDNVRNNLFANYTQKDDIDLSEWSTTYWDGSEDQPWEYWIPIGNEEGSVGIDRAFQGTYDGNNKVIRNVVVNNPYMDFWEGFFGHIVNATIENVRLENVTMSTGKRRYECAALVGAVDAGTIRNCHVVGGMIIGDYIVGGLLGLVNPLLHHPIFTYHPTTIGNILIEGCSANITVKGDDLASTRPDAEMLGGFAGAVWGRSTHVLEVKKCFSLGDVEGELPSYRMGGFVGHLDEAIIENCYARGSITGNFRTDGADRPAVGGFAGMGSYGATLLHCYSTGLVDITDDVVGGFIGDFDTYGDPTTITNCYYDTETSGQSDAGNGEPRLTAQMVYPYTAKHVEGIFVDWEFENYHITDTTGFDFIITGEEIWHHDPDFELNDGYPQFEPVRGGLVDPTLTKIADCYTPTNPLFSVSLDYGPFNNMVIERQDPMIAQHRFTNPPTGLTLKTKWRYLTPKLEHNVVCGFEVRGILIRYKLKGKKPKLIPEFE